mgnify:FL=1
MSEIKSCSDPKIQLFCGDKVTYEECFGSKILIFVGMAEQLDHNNDCVVTHNGDACPVRRSGLVRVS